MKNKLNPKYIIIDMKELILDFMRKPNLYEIYRHISLQDLISTILTVPAYLDDQQFVWEIVGQRLENVIDNLDIAAVDFFIHNLTEYLDHHIGHTVNDSVMDYGNYAFDKWLDSTTIVLVDRENNRPPWFESSPARKLQSLSTI